MFSSWVGSEIKFSKLSEGGLVPHKGHLQSVNLHPLSLTSSVIMSSLSFSLISPQQCPLILKYKHSQQSGLWEFVGKPALIFHLPIRARFFPPPLVLLSPFLLLLPVPLSPSHFLSIFFFHPPTNYLQDYRFRVGGDWVSQGVMWALRCLLNGEHHELWTNYSQSSTTPESQQTQQLHTHTFFFPNANQPLCAKTRTHTLIIVTTADTHTHDLIFDFSHLGRFLAKDLF